MIKITSEEFQRNTNLYQKAALTQPVAISGYDHDHLVLLDAEIYKQLHKRFRVVLDVRDLSNNDIQHIEDSNISKVYNYLNDEIP